MVLLTIPRRICVFLLLFTLALTKSISAQTVSDSLELRRLWLALDGPKWTYTEEALKTGDQWFSGSPMAQWCNISVSTDHSLKGVSIQSFMVPADGILHYNIWSKFKSLETFEVTYCPQVRRLYSDSLALFPSLRSLTFAHNSALGVLSSSFFTARQASLQYVDLAHNQLSDTIPYASIALCKYLTDLSLSHNNFSGAFHPRVMDMGSATIYSRYLNLSFNQLNAIVPNTYTIPASGITLQLDHNLISNDNGFIKKLYSALANHPNASYWYFDNNRLSNSKLVTTQAPMDNGYYAISPSNYVYVMPQFLGDTVYMDINRLQTAAAVSAPTPVAYDAAFTNIIYTLDGTLTNLGTGAVSLQNASTATNIALSQSAVQTLIGYKKDRMVLNTYINSAPVSSSSELDYKYIQFAPAIIRFYDQPVISLKGVNPLLCQDKKLFKIRLEALGIAATSTVQVAFRKTELVNGNAVVTNYPLNNTLFKSAALVSDKFVYIEVPLSVNASNCKFEITAIEVKNQLGLPITGITFTNAENNASVHTAYKPVQVSVQDYFCGSNDTLKVKVAHPEPFVRYSLNLPDFVSTLQGDTLYLTKSRLNAEYDRFHLQVFADIEGSCHASIYNKSVKLVQDLNNEADEEMILVPPSCTADALFKFPKPRPDFYYTPGYSGDVSSGFLEQYKTLASAVDTLAIKVHKADLPNYSYSYIKIEHKSCPNIYSEMAYPYHYIYYADTFKLQATDSLAVVNFVERTGYLPDASSDYQWYGRSIYDVSAKTYAPLKDWSYSGAWSNANLFQVMCGRIVGLDFSDKQSSAPSIGNGRDFSLAIDSLPELRSLNISNNYFAGKFDFPKVLNTTHIKSIDISYNDFVDTSFQNFSATALANVKVNARYNRLTYLSLLKANNPQSNGLLLPQGDIDFNAIREVYEHGTIKVVNTFPDTRDGKLSYKWYRSIDGSPILVSTERDLLIPDVERWHDGWYHCVVKHPDFKTQKRTGGWVQDSILAYGLRIMVTICDASPNDSLALVNFHNSLKVGPGWDLSKPVKTWKGVKFECAHVQEINLSGEGLIGVVSGLNRLKYLEKLDLSNNALDSISFPLSSFNLDVMRSIDLSNNRIRDSKYQRFYPYTKAIMLDTLKLRGNFFTGFFSFVNFTPTHLDLKGNRITGFEMIYDPWAGTERRAKPNHNEGDKAAQRRAAGVFSNFKTKYLDVSGNDLTADAFYVDSLNMIKHLDLSRNRFASTFPNLEEFSDSLQYLNLSYNQFSGTLPSLSSLRKLDTLIVSHNGFGGSVNTINLWKTPGKPISHLDLGNNNFFGAVSDSFSLLSRLQYLALDSNAAFNDERLLVKIQSLPVVPPMGLRQLHVENNQLHFGHLKNYAALGKGLKWYPQDSLDVRSPSRNFAQDSSYVYDAAIANNEDAAQIYQWYRIKLDGTREKLNASAKLLLNDLQKTDIGTYFASVKHSSLSTDSLITKKFFVNVTYCRLNIKDSLAMLHFYKNAKMAMPVTFDPKRAGTWPGIKLECEYITEIRLPNRSLSGTLTGLDSLLYLEVLDLSGNSLKSTTLKLDTIINKLRVVKLTNNGLKLYNPYMSFPTKSTEAADTMDLSGNSLKSFYSYGVLPKYLNLSKDSLSYLYMSSPFGQPHTLQHFDASHNLISNVILTNGMNGLLDTVLTSRELRYLDISHNNVGGTFSLPRIFPKLEYLDVSHNALYELGTGSKLGSHLSLRHLDLGNNMFVSTFNDTLSNLAQLRYFAIDSNRVEDNESYAGITGLPKLPQNQGLQLYVQDNHLDFIDLQPYSALFNKEAARYAPQYDTVDYNEVIRPAVGTSVSLSTSLAGDKSYYSWFKSIKPVGSIPVTKAGASLKTLKFTFALADTGTYFAKIGNTDFPGLIFTRRNIDLLTCKVSYKVRYSLRSSGNKCVDTDTLGAILTYTNNQPVTQKQIFWYFNDRLIDKEYVNYLKVSASGAYHYSVYDGISGCSINAVDTLVDVSAGVRPLIEYSSQEDSSLVNLSTYVQANIPHHQWFINGWPIAGATDMTLRVRYNGTYHLITTFKDSCTSTSAPLYIGEFSRTFVRSEHSVNNKGQVVLDALQRISVHPNPANGYFTVSNVPTGGKVIITNLQGGILWQTIATQSDQIIDAAAMPSGMYLVGVSYLGSFSWTKVIIE